MFQNLIRTFTLCGLTAVLVLLWASVFGQTGYLPLVVLCVCMAGLVLAVDSQARLNAAMPRWILKRVPSLDKGRQIRACLRTRLGDETFVSWFNALEFEGFDGRTVTLSVPVQFLMNWIQSHYLSELTECCRAAFPNMQNARVVTRSLKSVCP